MPAKNELIIIRPGQMEDANFIFTTWLKGLWFGNDWFGLIDSKVYFDTQHKIIESLLSQLTTKVSVACLKDDPKVILGYSVYSGHRLHWTHVKKAWRKIGLAKDLVPKEITTVTHVTEVGRSIMKKHSNIIFNPFDLT